MTDNTDARSRLENMMKKAVEEAESNREQALAIFKQRLLEQDDAASLMLVLFSGYGTIERLAVAQDSISPASVRGQGHEGRRVKHLFNIVDEFDQLADSMTGRAFAEAVPGPGDRANRHPAGLSAPPSQGRPLRHRDLQCGSDGVSVGRWQASAVGMRAVG
jgi:hypothetical protein